MTKTMRLASKYHPRKRSGLILPVVLISNRDLVLYGFGIGDIIEVEYLPKRLVIRKVRDNPDGGVTLPIPEL